MRESIYEREREREREREKGSVCKREAEVGRGGFGKGGFDSFLWTLLFWASGWDAAGDVITDVSRPTPSPDSHAHG
jgi:hypothetical protein